MDGYTVGSVADFISQDKGVKTKSKKSKKLTLRINEKTEEVKPRKKAEVSESSVKKKKKVEPTSDENEPKLKKQKKTISDVLSTNELEIDVSDFEHVPSDSEEENDEDYSETTPKTKNKNISSKKFEHNDFTENTVFVGNIPINYTKQKICKMFSKFGKIKNARIRCVPIADINMSKKVAAVKKQFNPKRNSLVAYVKFVSEYSVKAALEANGMVVDGHHLRIDKAEESKERDNNKAVFVGGLPFNIEDDELWEFFENCGKINSVRVIRDSHTSMGKGFGYVNFDCTTSVELALKLDGHELKKRQINVKRCMKGRNKNKQNSFGKNKSMELTTQLLAKGGKKLKTEKKKLKTEKKPFSNNFQGRKATVKQKKKKKLSKAALKKKKIMKILGSS